MSGAFHAGRRRRRPSINITPLIDVIFLLLIFFMVSSTFKEHMGIDITLPQAENTANQDVNTHEIIVDLHGDFYVDGQGLDAAGVRRELAAILERDPDATLVLRADANADFGHVVRAMDIARDVGGIHLIIPTDPPEESARP